jgi:hypothetical protein
MKMSNWEDIKFVPIGRPVLLATSKEAFVGEAYKVDEVALREAYRTPMFCYTPSAEAERTAFRGNNVTGDISPTHWQELPALPERSLIQEVEEMKDAVEKLKRLIENP